MRTSVGMEHVNKLYENRTVRAVEIKREGGNIIGYFCCHTPVELITAAGLVPYRIQGSVSEPIREADAYLESITCSFARSCFDLALKGQYEFLDGLVVPHTCDTIHRIYDIWRVYSPLRYTHFINVPHMTDSSSQKFFKSELERFKKSLEKLSKKEITEQGINKAIALHDENRTLLRQLYELRKPPLISGSDVLRVLVAGMCLPVREFNDVLRDVLRDIRNRETLPSQPRILIYGAEIDDISLIELIEKSGGQVVMDDICTGSRGFWQVSDIDGDPLTRLAKHYLNDIPCPRTYRPQQSDKYEAHRFRYLLDLIHEFNVQGVIAYVHSYCDTYELEAPSLRDYLQASSIPVLFLAGDYVLSNKAQLQTRIQAFLEMIA